MHDNTTQKYVSKKKKIFEQPPIINSRREQLLDDGTLQRLDRRSLFLYMVIMM
jgi:hypothetical protein